MIGIVIVAHSARLAEGVRELADQMGQGRVPLAIAGGIQDPENPIGTNPLDVLRAIESVYSDDGVVVLMDLGSALLSAETALEFLPEERRDRVHLCSAPLVEGAVAATVQALAGQDIGSVIAEARRALEAKVAQLRDVAPALAGLTPDAGAAPAHETVLTIPNELGLHARPAAQFVKLASRFVAQVTLRNLTEETPPVNAKSIVQVMMAGVRGGQRVAIVAQGPDAAEALATLAALVEAGFGELGKPVGVAPQTPLALPVQLAMGELAGTPASPGIAIGPLSVLRPSAIAVPEKHVDNPQAEWQRLQAAMRTARQEIQVLRQRAVSRVGEQQAAILDAHLLFLEDPVLVAAASRRIIEGHTSADFAWQQAVAELAASYSALRDPYLQARAADLLDVGQRVLQRLTGAASASFDLSQPAILAAQDLPPSIIEHLDPARVLGICTEGGSPNAHSAILARSLGIPMVVGLGPGVSALAEGTLVALDGRRGRVWVSPGADTAAQLQAQREAWLVFRQAARAVSQRPAVTRDGRKVRVLANIARLADVRPALENGAEGVGVLRTEFLYLHRVVAPSEEEQAATYRAIAEALGPRPLVIRTLDVGGDKPLAYLQMEQEANPFLGWRGLRVSLDRPDMFLTQLRAILRASPGYRIEIMFPMVSTVSEVRAAKALLAEAQRGLRQANIPFDEAMKVGIMIEVPSAVVVADRLAAEVDFFSIGTNDLCQYAVAADRTNPRVAALADPFQPAILRLIHWTIQAAHRAGIWAALCGEFAGDPLGTPLLLGMGLDEWSMGIPAIPAVKQAIAQLSVAETEAVVQDALKLNSAEAIRRCVLDRFPDMASNLST